MAELMSLHEQIIRAELQRRADERIMDEAERRTRADQQWAREEGARRVESLNAHSAAEAERAEQFYNGGKAEPDAKPDTDSSKPQPDKATEPMRDAKSADSKAPPSPDASERYKLRDVRLGVKPATAMGLPPGVDLRTGEPVKGIKGLLKAQVGAGQHYAGKLGTKAGAKLAEKGLQGLGKSALKTAARALPGVGSVVAGYLAVQDFKRGDYVGGVLNAIGVIPGPVGWISMGLAAGWDILKPHKTFGMWDQPDGTNTFMLPAEAKDVSGVKDSDAALRAAQNGVFSYQDGPTGTVWNENSPESLRLDTAEVVAAATAWLTGISDHFAEIDKVMLQADEQDISRYRQALAPHFTAMAKLKTQVKDLTDQLTASSAAAETGYRAVLETNKNARTQLSSDGTLSDHGPATVMKTKLQNAQTGIAAANSKIEQLWAETPPAIVEARTVAVPGTRTAPETKVTPVATAPAPVSPSIQPATTAPTKTETPTKQNDDLSKLLSQLGQQAKSATPSTPASNPLGSGSGLGGGSPLGTGTGQGNGQGGTPLSSSKPDTKTDDSDKKKLGKRKTEEPKKLDDKALSGAKPEQAKAAVPAEAKPAVPAPGVVAPAGPSPAQQNTAAAAKAEEPNKEVDVKGQKTTFPDAKTAKLAEILSKADPTHPMSLADAAKAAGLTPPVPGQDPGKQVSPADAKPGDIMVADGKNFMLLGDGKFYDLQDYKIVGTAELPQQLGDRAGYFHLNDPNPGGQPGQPGEQAPQGQQPPGAPEGPVSPQSTSGVQHQVPGATGAQAGPVDGNAPGQPAAPGGVPSVGTPGVPKPATPGAGPANAAATDTGTGTGGPTTGGGALDPSAVK